MSPIEPNNRLIAYFCAEYAVDPELPIYAGGLGILAGDYLREANDHHLPVVGVGLFYQFHNTAQLDVVRDSLGNPLRIEIPIENKKIQVQVFKKLIGSVPLYLLDTNIEENEPIDRKITDQLYVIDQTTRFKQELILGIGGFRVLQALNILPQRYHLNEGHSAFLVFELIRQAMQQHQLQFSAAVTAVHHQIVFTNHTLVIAGHDIYPPDLVKQMLSRYSLEMDVPVTELLQLGLDQASNLFSMTVMSLRMAGKINAVSKLHAQQAIPIWPDYPMIPITNGIHLPTWDRVKTVEQHPAHKQQLLDVIYQQTGIRWQPNQLLLGWARRFVEYKRPLAILDNLDQFLKIAQDVQHPVNLVFAGKPHQSDTQGKVLLKKLTNLIQHQAAGSVVYLPDYNSELALQLVAGCDVWLNTPRVGFEACGTSGMKAALNGGLLCSTADGWIAETDISQAGWLLSNDHLSEDILRVLEQHIIPKYYDHQSEWEVWMNHARQLIIDHYSTTRMMREYREKLYV